MSQNWDLADRPEIHFELWVSKTINRLRVRRSLRRAYKIARPLTQQGGGSGPWVFIIRPDPVTAKSARLRATLGLQSKEDLWLELVFYPNAKRMKGIIKKIWGHPEFSKIAEGLDKLVSKRKRGYDATVALGWLQQV